MAFCCVLQRALPPGGEIWRAILDRQAARFLARYAVGQVGLYRHNWPGPKRRNDSFRGGRPGARPDTGNEAGPGVTPAPRPLEQPAVSASR